MKKERRKIVSKFQRQLIRIYTLNSVNWRNFFLSFFLFFTKKTKIWIIDG